MNKKKSPGSLEAIGVGCTCPFLENKMGEGSRTESGKKIFIVDTRCPLHKTSASFKFYSIQLREE